MSDSSCWASWFYIFSGANGLIGGHNGAGVAGFIVHIELHKYIILVLLTMSKTEDGVAAVTTVKNTQADLFSKTLTDYDEVQDKIRDARVNLKREHAAFIVFKSENDIPDYFDEMRHTKDIRVWIDNEPFTYDPAVAGFFTTGDAEYIIEHLSDDGIELTRAARAFIDAVPEAEKFIRLAVGEYIRKCNYTDRVVDEAATEKLRKKYRAFVSGIADLTMTLENYEEHLAQIKSKVDHYDKMANLSNKIAGSTAGGVKRKQVDEYEFEEE